MQLRSGRRLVPPPPIGAGARRGRPRRRRTTTEGADGPVDRLSDLPEELILEVLARLGCPREAARTSVLARAWRRRWTRLPGEWTLDVVDPAEPIQCCDRAQLHYRSKSNHVFITARPSRRIAAPLLTSLLRIAAQLEPAELHVPELWVRDPAKPFELPCFERTTSIMLNNRTCYFYELNFTLPPAGVFASLETLCVVCSGAVDVGGLLARCPRLRCLCLYGRWSNWFHGSWSTLAIHSASLEKLTLGVREDEHRVLRHVDIVAPKLKKFTRPWRYWHQGPDDFSVSYSMPMVEKVSMCYSRLTPVGSGPSGYEWRPLMIRIGTTWVDEPSERVRALSIKIIACVDHECPPVERSFAQEIAGFPGVQEMAGGTGVIDFSILELKLRTNKGHVFGALVLELLQIRSIRRLKLVLRISEYEFMVRDCKENCVGNQVSNGRNKQISLTDLEVAVIEGFCGADHEIDFLKLLFQCAAMLKRMTVRLFVEASPKGVCQELRTIFQASTCVECSVYDSCGKKIYFA